MVSLLSETDTDGDGEISRLELLQHVTRTIMIAVSLTKDANKQEKNFFRKRADGPTTTIPPSLKGYFNSRLEKILIPCSGSTHGGGLAPDSINAQ